MPQNIENMYDLEEIESFQRMILEQKLEDNLSYQSNL